MIPTTPLGSFAASATSNVQGGMEGVGLNMQPGGIAAYSDGYSAYVVGNNSVVSVVCRSTVGNIGDIFIFDGANFSVGTNYQNIDGGYWNDSDNVVHWDSGVLYSKGLPIYSGGDISCACVASGGYLVTSTNGNVQLITASGTSKYSEWLPVVPTNSSGKNLVMQAQAFVSKNVLATIYAYPYNSRAESNIAAYTPMVLLTTVDVTNDGLTLTTIGTYPVVVPSDWITDPSILYVNMEPTYFVHQDSASGFYRASTDILVTAAGLSAGKSLPPGVAYIQNPTNFTNTTEKIVSMIDTVLDISVYGGAVDTINMGYLSMGGTTITLPIVPYPHVYMVSTAYDDTYAYCAIDGTVYSMPLGGGDVTSTIMPQSINSLVCEVIQ